MRLPKVAAFPESVKEVRVIRQGEGLLLVPVDALWDDFFNSPPITDWPDRAPQGEWPKREDW